ncbi:thermonuclease family protein [Stutzerimonas chloritidismutans]|uniref:thermonuclease family protein n=1 Tax=Stutzerimonas chloritidismutans TaxID=203192 RepID=UPI003F17D1C4
MRLATALKKASHVGAFFVSVLLALPALALCPVQGGLESVAVAKVIDGDTLRLVDGRSVRLIGLNSPELGRRGQRSEPWASAAKQRLEQLVAASDRRLGLRPGQQIRDHYGRYLAHAYDRHGNNLEALMLEQGLGYFVAIAPNVALAGCHREAERSARRHRRGVWQGDPVVAVNELRKAGFAVVRGRVQRVVRNRGGVWLEFDGLAVQVAHRDARGFGDFDTQLGRVVEIRGWVIDRKGHQGARGQARWKLGISHPFMVEALR